MKKPRQPDPRLRTYLGAELRRQQSTLSLIPSENYASTAVLRALGSVIVNKYSEGYPGRRYYGGNEIADRIEQLAQARATQLFGYQHANVQPYSGSPANQAVCFAWLEPGDVLMGMDLRFGGHLTHGWKVNFSGRYYRAAQYGTDQRGFLDYDAIDKLARQRRPKLIFVGATAYPRKFDFRRLSAIAESVDACLVADISHIAALVISGDHPSPRGFADIVTTTTHKTLRGPRGAIILCNGLPSTPLKSVPRERKYLPTLIDRAVFPGLQGGPHNNQTAAIAAALGEARTATFRHYAHQIVKNARTLAGSLLSCGLDLVTGGTDNHLILIDLRNIGVSGQEAQTALERIGVIANKNAVPFDPRPPFNPSGLRMGSPAITTRGLREKEVAVLGHAIADTLRQPHSAKVIRQSRTVVSTLARSHPIYQGQEL